MLEVKDTLGELPTEFIEGLVKEFDNLFSFLLSSTFRGEIKGVSADNNEDTESLKFSFFVFFDSTEVNKDFLEKLF
jgi:hypothetical protein